MRGVNNGSRETVNAAAEAIVAAENREQQIQVQQKRKWILRFFPCFAPNPLKINQAALAPEPSPSRPVNPLSGPLNPLNRPVNPLPNPPPSSPASSLSLLNSNTQSPVLSPVFSFGPYSPNFSFGPYSIGPYANELTNLVSPPVYSTDPSTAPFTPLMLTTPNSPEVPFAHFLTNFYPNGSQISPNSGNSSNSSPYRQGLNLKDSKISTSSDPNWLNQFQISPNSGYSSNNSSPYRQCLNLKDSKISTSSDPNGSNQFQISPNSGYSSNNSSPYRQRLDLNFPIREAPKITEDIFARKSMKFHARKDGSLLDGHISAIGSTVDQVLAGDVDKSEPSVSIKESKEFKFENSEGVNGKSDTSEVAKSWPFFPLESGVS